MEFQNIYRIPFPMKFVIRIPRKIPYLPMLRNTFCGAVLIVCALFLGAEVVDGSDYYGRAFGSAKNWQLVDSGTSHHLEVYFNPMPNYSTFQANIDVRSKDGTSLSVAYVKNITSVLSNIKGVLTVMFIFTNDASFRIHSFIHSARVDHSHGKRIRGWLFILLACPDGPLNPMFPGCDFSGGSDQ